MEIKYDKKTVTISYLFSKVGGIGHVFVLFFFYMGLNWKDVSNKNYGAKRKSLYFQVVNIST